MKYPKGFHVVCKPENVEEGYRYILKIETTAKSLKTLLVLMRNPSIANKDVMDPTIKHLIASFGMKYKKIIVVNTVPIIARSKNSLMERFKSLGKSKIIQRNIDEITRLVADLKCFDALIATGTPISNLNKKSYVKLINLINTSTARNKIFVVSILSDGYSGILRGHFKNTILVSMKHES